MDVGGNGSYQSLIMQIGRCADLDLDVAESGTWWIGVRGDVEALENGVLE